MMASEQESAVLEVSQVLRPVVSRAERRITFFMPATGRCQQASGAPRPRKIP